MYGHGSDNQVLCSWRGPYKWKSWPRVHTHPIHESAQSNSRQVGHLAAIVVRWRTLSADTAYCFVGLSAHNIQWIRANSDWFQCCQAIRNPAIENQDLFQWLRSKRKRPSIPHILTVVGLYFDGKSNSKVNPSIANEFAAAAFRYGHTTVRNQFSRRNINNQQTSTVNLGDIIFRPVEAYK